MEHHVTRKVGWKLVVGIVFLPIVFAWFLLKPGYSVLARALSFGWMALVIFGSVLGSGVERHLEQPHVKSTPAATSAPSVKKSNNRRTAEARAAVRARLKDPNSAQFGDAIVTERAVCGSVNAKNGFGGYTGPQPFIVIGSVAFMPNDAPEEWAEMWSRACTN